MVADLADVLAPDGHALPLLQLVRRAHLLRYLHQPCHASALLQEISKSKRKATALMHEECIQYHVHGIQGMVRGWAKV